MLKILIIDDEAGVREFFRRALARLGHTIIIAENGRLGWEAFLRERPDMVFSDICMPEMTGLEFLEKVREVDFQAIVLLITAYGNEENTLTALRLRANDFILKPVRLPQLLNLTEKYARIIDARTEQQKIQGLIISRSFTMEFGNDIRLVERIVDHLLQQAESILPEKDILGIRLGLAELLMNAIEHGNLEISFADKTDALEAGNNSLEKLFADRLKDDNLANRRVRIEFFVDENTCEWTISDQGKGFDVDTLPDPLDPENLLEAHGRGIFLARLQFDDLQYDAKGTRVKVRKARKKAIGLPSVA